MGSNVSIGLIDNDPLALRQLAGALPKLLPGSWVVWSTSSADEGRRKCVDEEWTPDLAVIDIELDGMSGVELCRSIRRDSATLKIVGVTSYNPRKYAQELADSGAQGIMVKGNMAQMMTALRKVSAGSTFSPIPNIMFPTVTEGVQRIRVEHEQTEQALNKTEETIIEMVSQGFTTDEIASLLNVTSSTVRSHTQHIRKVMGAKTLSHAVALWMLHEAR